jgi:hypothetical protein
MACPFNWQAVYISGHKSKVKRKSSKPRIYAFLTYQLQQMKPPGAPRQPLGEVSPNQRSRVVSARERSIPFPVIARMEDLQDSTIQSVVSYISSPRTGRPLLLTAIDHCAIRRAIVVNPKITTHQLFIIYTPHTLKKTVYQYLKKSGIQK